MLTFAIIFQILIYNRPPLFQKVKTNLSVINSVNSLLSTVHFVMMRTKLVKTVVKLATESTIVLNNATSLPTLSVAFVVMLGIWLEIVQIDLVVPIGVMMALQVQMLYQVKVVLAQAMLLTANMR